VERLSPGVDHSGQNLHDESNAIVKSPVLNRAEATIGKVRPEMLICLLG
jgi:hypothetical protein